MSLPIDDKAVGRRLDQPRSGTTRDIEARLDELFARWDRADAPGIAIGVSRRGRVIYRRGFGMASLEHAVAMNPKTRVRIASVSKHFTALLALLLVEEGKLDLDAPIRDYLPELVGPGGDPSIRFLLQHRGGSRCFFDLGVIARGLKMPPNGTALDRQVRQTGRNFVPGEAMLYNNGGYHLASLAIERQTGEDFGAQLKGRFFDPLRMYDTAAISSDLVVAENVATLHVAEGDGWRRGVFPSEEILGEGSIVSTVDDMLLWTAHLRSRHLFGSDETWRVLEERPVFPDGWIGPYAMGLVHGRVGGRRSLHHAGGVIGGLSQMLVLPDEDLAVVILANGAPDAYPVRLASQIVDIALPEHSWRASPSIEAKKHPDLIGDWWSAEAGMLHGIVDDAGSLKLNLFGEGTSYGLEPDAGGALACHGPSFSRITILAAPSGDKDALDLTFGGQTRRYQRLPTPDARAPNPLPQAEGVYYAHDANCHARIDARVEGVSIRLNDEFGSTSGELLPRCPSAAILIPTDPTGERSTLNFSRDEYGVSGFHLNSARTRKLEFRRAPTRDLTGDSAP